MDQLRSRQDFLFLPLNTLVSSTSPGGCGRRAGYRTLT